MGITKTEEKLPQLAIDKYRHPFYSVNEVNNKQREFIQAIMLPDFLDMNRNTFYI